LATALLVVRDEEAAGSNPVTPTSVSAGQRPAAGCDQIQEVVNVSDLLVNFRESADIVVHSCEFRGNRPELARRTHSRARHARIEVVLNPGLDPMSWSSVACRSLPSRRPGGRRPSVGALYR
jgi:hypothetical protein